MQFNTHVEMGNIASYVSASYVQNVTEILLGLFIVTYTFKLYYNIATETLYYLAI